jgi:hypothetical protein
MLLPDDLNLKQEDQEQKGMEKIGNLINLRKEVGQQVLVVAVRKSIGVMV